MKENDETNVCKRETMYNERKRREKEKKRSPSTKREKNTCMRKEGEIFAKTVKERVRKGERKREGN